MSKKVLRIIIGLPFALVMWPFFIIYYPIVAFLMWLIEGHLEYLEHDLLWLPVKFVKHVLES